MGKIVTWLLAVGVSAAPAWPVDALTVHFSWKGIKACENVSPAFSIRGAPKATTALRFLMHDNDAPAFHHGGSTIPYDGSGTVPEGAITYVGPCPPPGQRHHYIWTVEALDAAGHVLGRANALGLFPPR
jgi:phosphatidylethanolamine-binding protein (PEBP) family uncharacterized protein